MDWVHLDQDTIKDGLVWVRNYGPNDSTCSIKTGDFLTKILSTFSYYMTDLVLGLFNKFHNICSRLAHIGLLQ